MTIQCARSYALLGYARLRFCHKKLEFMQCIAYMHVVYTCAQCIDVHCVLRTVSVLGMVWQMIIAQGNFMIIQCARSYAMLGDARLRICHKKLEFMQCIAYMHAVYTCMQCIHARSV